MPFRSISDTVQIAKNIISIIAAKRLLLLIVIIVVVLSYNFLILLPSSNFLLFSEKKKISDDNSGGTSMSRPIVAALDNNNKCSSGWNITGYFSPVESDYDKNGYNQTILLHSISDDRFASKQTFNSEFLKDVRIEGWGQTNQNEYIGKWNDKFWGSSTYAEGDHGDPLIAGVSAATDRSIIPYRANFTIPSLPSPWNTKTFTATDIGPDIVGKHIDIYTGVGIAAQKETMKITGSENIVCISRIVT